MKRLLLVLMALAALGGCTANDNNQTTDPRIGRVWLDSDPCDLFDCYGPWKTCTGPDLLTYVPVRDAEDKYITTRNSVECKP